MMPRGGERQASHFYGELLGLASIPKPADMENPEGLWFTLGDQQLHLGVQEDPPHASRAHVALIVDDLDALADALRAAGVEVKESNDAGELRRAHVWDPFGNRLELMGD
jgi:predicted enzyme related to lactoylglutathione lyase